MSLGIDPVDMGIQAGEIANKILSTMDAKDMQGVAARKIVISTNLMLARKLGIRLDVARGPGPSMKKKIVTNAWMFN